MVEINNQRKAFIDNSVVGADNGRQKTRNHGYDVIVGRRAIYWLLRSPSQTCHAKPKTQNQQAPDATSFFPVGGMPTASSLAWKTSLRKVGTLWHCSRLRAWRFTYDWSWWYPSGNRPLLTISGLPAGHGYGQFEGHKADSLIAKFKAGGRVRDWCMSRGTAIISALVICIIVCLSWAVNHYRDNAITYKAQRDKNARELKLANAAVQHADASAWCCCARCKIHEGVGECKAENDALRDDVAAGRRRLHIKAVCQSVREATASVDNAASPELADTAEQDYFTLRERLITMQKNNWKEPKDILMSSADRVALMMGSSCNYCEQYTRASSGV